MILEIISLFAAIAEIVTFIIILGFIWVDKIPINLKVFVTLFMSMIFTFVISLSASPSIVNIVRDIKYTYEPPTNIFKTNDTTFVNHIVGQEIVISFISTDTVFWNCTNILIEIKSGKNFWGEPLESKQYKVVTKRS